MRPFLKMHGLGNDFVIFDARTEPLMMNEELSSRVANRHRGVGCDQLIVLRASEKADVFMEIWNADGSRVGACGNATRCVGMLILDELSQDEVSIETDAGLLSAKRAAAGISVNMGPARTEWNEIPLASEMATDSADFEIDGVSAPGCVNMGNPHAIFFVDNAENEHIEVIGPQAELNELFPERVNASIASVDNGIIRLRVWERGAGITEACGTAACASVVAATRKGLIDRKATVRLDGGDLEVEWLEDGTVQMTGAATLVYKGEIAV
ncbi:diaminopimelate epimerase [Kordiimonas sp. SCSIO 12603]|uniref:diaminopimelate epimerase n=1 Tax=Kordiimonas sp. SCSIO 12603 TaxID=2829596 RepID=UPI0021020127|nr:diaminopimelate epimerase [Kordiimonas sp. SCSIO 12603]